MSDRIASATIFRPGLIWGFDLGVGGALPIPHDVDQLAIDSPAGHFRWLHFNLADQWTQRWIKSTQGLAPLGRDLLLSPDRHQRVVIGEGMIAGLIHDFERDFDPEAVARTGQLSFLLTDRLMITARQHPLCAADVIHRRITSGVCPTTPAAALELLVSAVAEVSSKIVEDLILTVQASEDRLLDDGRAPDTRAFVTLRRRAVQLHRHLAGLRNLLTRLEDDDDVSLDLGSSTARLVQRIGALDADVLLLQSNVRYLREEVDIQTANRTNQNLYILSMLTALLMPATLVTGFFGMNTGGLLWNHDGSGTLYAALLAVAAAAAAFLWLYAQGFFRR
jgi:zinc transporter